MGNEYGSPNSEAAFFNKYATPANLSSKGAFGTVYGPIRYKGMQLAIKQVIFADGKSPDEIKKDISEKRKIWASLEHKHLARILTVNLIHFPKVIYIVMEFAAGGSLNETLRSLASEHIKLPIDFVTDWTKQIAEGMKYLHQKDIVHRDLKPSNILLSEPFDASNPRKTMTLKITDFDDVKKHNHTTTLSFVGTMKYMAPELLQNQRFSKASDVWSFGVLIWEMLSGDIPHKGLQPFEIWNKSLKGELDCLFIEPSFPADYKFILEQCWKSTCNDRISFHQILEVLHTIEICGLTSLHQEVFVSRERHPFIEVYDSTTFVFKRRMAVDGLTIPSNLVSCSINNCLYAVDSSYRKQVPAILRIDPINGNVIKAHNLRICGRRILLSVANDSNLIVSNHESHLYEYTADGELIRTINLCCASDGPIHRNIEATHAVKLDSGLFVVCQSYMKAVYLLTTKETPARGMDEAEILKEFSKLDLPGKIDYTLQWPDYLSVDKESSILISDKYINNHINVLLSSNLDEARILVSKQYGMKSSNRTCFNKSTGEWLITDGRRIMVCRVKDENVDRKIYEINGNG